MLTDRQCADRRSQARASLERRRQMRAKETAANFATCRDLAASLRRQNLPQKFISQYQRRAAYWRCAFAVALVDELDRTLYLDEVDCALFLHVGSGTP